MTAQDVVNKLGGQIRIKAISPLDSEALHAVGNAMHRLSEVEAQALIDLLEDWAGTR